MKYYRIRLSERDFSKTYTETIALDNEYCLVAIAEEIPGAVEITEGDFAAARPVYTPTSVISITMDELKNNQLIIMGALADIFETMIGGS